ncbi:MAG: response regulator [Gammaproteobacteria bacterium]|nr:response regulator [Pseudomonadales bacterium]MCP5345735.1 response regulator [Pseudomonadales bacterium]
MQVLLVEDDNLLADAVVVALKRHNFAINRVSNGKDALLVTETTPPDIVILDLGLPDMDGIDVLRKFRRQGFANPVLILTARDSIEDRVTGLDSGADDYLPKPFDIDELLARLRALERRLSKTSSAIIALGNVSLDTNTHELQVDGNQVDLARREYMLLKALMESGNKIQTRESLENKLYSWGEEISSNAVEVHIHHLRKKLPDGFIQTVRGVGYIIRTPKPDSPGGS